MYKLNKPFCSSYSVTRLVDGAVIPFDEGNHDYLKYLEWLAEGNIPEPALSLEEAKNEKTSEIEAYRDLETIKNVTALNTEWQADKVSQTLLSSTITLASAGLPLPPVWRDFFNNDVAITSLNDLLAIAGAMAIQTQAAYSKSWAKKAAINAATTVEEVAAIGWDSP